MRHTPSLRVLLASLSLITSAAAHGYITNVTINSTVYRGNVLAQSDQTPFLSIIWQKFSNDPVVSTGTPDLTSTDLICGHKATRAAKSAPVAAGDAISIAYYSDYNPDSSKWPHAVGPVMIYLADCGAMTCDKFDVTKAQWFKIDEQGKNKTGDWPAQYALSVGSSLALTIPSNLNPGNYILRHEIVSLERSSANITEFYPNCFDLIVSGTGNGRPTTKETVRFPGAYKATDTDIGYYDPYTNKATTPYTFPGPPVAAFVSSGGNSEESIDPGSESTSTSTIKSGSSNSAAAAEEITSISTSTPISTPTSHTTSPVPKSKVKTVDDRADADSATPSATPEDPILKAALSPSAQDSGAAQSRDRALTAVVVIFALWAFYAAE